MNINMARKKKEPEREVLLFGARHNADESEEFISVLRPRIRRGMKAGLEIEQERLNTCKELFERNLSEEELHEGLEKVVREDLKLLNKHFDPDYIFAIRDRQTLKENIDSLRFFYDVYAFLRRSGVEVHAMGSRSILLRAANNRGLISRNTWPYDSKEKNLRKILKDPKAVKKETEAGPMRDKQFVKTVVNEGLDIAIAGASHADGMRTFRIPGMRWTIAYMHPVYDKLDRWFHQEIRKRYQQRIKRTVKRLKRRPGKKESLEKMRTLKRAYKPRKLRG